MGRAEHHLTGVLRTICLPVSSATPLTKMRREGLAIREHRILAHRRRHSDIMVFLRKRGGKRQPSEEGCVHFRR